GDGLLLLHMSLPRSADLLGEAGQKFQKNWRQLQGRQQIWQFSDLWV
ncbi:hypothetical protein DBR06_SOUSAS9310038, partial [Sousa chinensis]